MDSYKLVFYDGPLDILIHIRDLENNKIKDDNPDADFNIHSLQNTKKILKNMDIKLLRLTIFFHQLN